MTLLLPRDTFPGVKSTLLKHVAAKLWDMQSASPYDLAVCLGASEKLTRGVWEKLRDDGYLVTDENERHVPTEKMHSLMSARFGGALLRPKADALLAKTIANAQALNALPVSAPFFYVAQLVVFGSYLDEERTELGDLDLAWLPAMRKGVESHARTRRLYGEDPLQSTRAVLRPRSPFARLVTTTVVAELECPFRVCYEFMPPAESLARPIRGAVLANT